MGIRESFYSSNHTSRIIRKIHFQNSLRRRIYEFDETEIVIRSCSDTNKMDE